MTKANTDLLRSLSKVIVVYNEFSVSVDITDQEVVENRDNSNFIMNRLVEGLDALSDEIMVRYNYLAEYVYHKEINADNYVEHVLEDITVHEIPTLDGYRHFKIKTRRCLVPKNQSP